MTVLNQTSQNASGQTLYTSGATQADVSSAISAQGLKPVTAAVIPPAPTPANVNPAVAGTNAAIAANTHTLTQAELDAQNAANGKTQFNTDRNSGISSDMASIFDKYINSLPKPTSGEAQYTADRTASGIDDKTMARNADKAALGSTLAQIQGLTAQAEAEKLAQENTFGTTGNTIGQQAQIDRNYAIKALHLQVQALVQQAVLSNSQDILDQAQKHLDTIYQIHSKDAENEYTYKTNLATAVYNFASKEQQAKLEELKLKQQQHFTEKQDNLKFQRELAGKATDARQGSLAAGIMSLDPNSSTFATDLATYQGKLQPKNDVQFVSATDNQPAGYFDNVTHTFHPLGGGTGGGNPSNYNGDFAATISTAAQLLGAQKAKSSQKNLTSYIANKDYKSAYNEIANNVEDSLTATNKTRFSSARTDIGVMAGLRDAINEYSNTPGAKMGYLKGSADQIAKNFGQLATDPKFAALGITLTREFQAYRNEMTGAAFTPQESAEYERVNPRSNASLDLNLTTIDGALAQLTNRVSSTINARVPGAEYIKEYAKGAKTKPAAAGGFDTASARSKYGY